MFNYLVNYFKVLVPQKSKKGQALVEYALIIALIAIVCIAAIGLVGTHANTLFNTIAGKL
ncbi:MAG: Flp family type IVb pilin [Clostridiaceae bacterium]